MGTLAIKKQSAASVSNPATDQLKLFVDSSDNILKTKDSSGVVRPSGVGTADELATTGSPVDLSAAAPPTAGQTLIATGPGAAEWQNIYSNLQQTPWQTGSISASVGQFVVANVTGVAATVNLPTAPAHGSIIGVKIATVATNTCTIDAGGSDQIDGAGTKVLSVNYAWAVLLYDSIHTNWMQIG